MRVSVRPDEARFPNPTARTKSRARGRASAFIPSGLQVASVCHRPTGPWHTAATGPCGANALARPGLATGAYVSGRARIAGMHAHATHAAWRAGPRVSRRRALGVARNSRAARGSLRVSRREPKRDPRARTRTRTLTLTHTREDYRPNSLRYMRTWTWSWLSFGTLPPEPSVV